MAEVTKSTNARSVGKICAYGDVFEQTVGLPSIVVLQFTLGLLIPIQVYVGREQLCNETIFIQFYFKCNQKLNEPKKNSPL